MVGLAKKVGYRPSMSMYAEYLKEIQGKTEILEENEGFLSFMISGQECYMADIYVRPEFRGSNKAMELFNKVSKIAKERGCTYLLSSVCPSINNSTRSIKFILSCGFDLFSAKENLIFFRKEL